MAKKCLYCYNELELESSDYHTKCSKKIFGMPTPPIIDFDESDISKMAEQLIQSHNAITGVQPKLSLSLSKNKNEEYQRFTVLGVLGNYILKPQTALYPELPEIEDLTMHLAEIAKINTVPHTLVRLKSGSLAYLTKRIDRAKFGKIHLEDMCQLTERLTEEKYNGSYEQIAKTIIKFSANPLLDVINLYEIVVFSYLTGNADMHLKNFSLIHNTNGDVTLAPAYDLVATAIVNPEDKEDLALTLNGKKHNIRKSDFSKSFKVVGLEEKQLQNIFTKMQKAQTKWLEMIDKSFVSDATKEKYRELVIKRVGVIS